MCVIFGYRTLKAASKTVVHKAAEFLGNKSNQNDDKIVKQEPVEEIIIPPDERD